MTNTYEGTAIDPAIFKEGQSTTEPAQIAEPESVIDPQTSGNEPSSQNKPAEDVTIPEKVTIPGVGDFTIDEIKEFRNGSLRQADYTKKTQELAKQREELKDAKELFDYLRANPYLVETLKEAEQNPNSVVHTSAPSYENEMFRDLAMKQRALEADIKMSALKQKYNDVDEIAIYQKAAELKTDDLEFVYKSLNYDNRNIDEQRIIEAAKEQFKQELEKNKGAVSTIVDNKPSSTPVQNVKLSDQEKSAAMAFGISEDEYAKWR